MKTINEMTRQEFEVLPHKEFNEDIEFNSMVILPGKIKDMHDSGYRCMDFVAVNGDKPICRLSGCSDVIHIDGIGGFGNNWLEKYGKVPDSIPVSGWSIDCLPKSGLLRIWPNSHRMTCSIPMSSFEIFALEKKEKPK